ncbi:hypothetical protein AX17_001256 [Amanita inopinata Kibby_2008]|nr:hypothetical protein AX17_001256 [Amanita inopinata Kibby_2008]
MSKVVDVSQKLGEYMLKGWVLSDVPCSTPGCRVPLLRSPETQLVTHFCPNCDAEPEALQKSLTTSSISSDTRLSPSSTPPTEVSDFPELPPFPPLVETEDMRRRREQSDRASQEIGNRLLRGWTMLSDECPNPNCNGIPLVRPPKAGGGKDIRKECVVCGTVYVDPSDAKQLIPRDLDVRPFVQSNEGASSEQHKIEPTKALQARNVVPVQSTDESLSRSAGTPHDAQETLQALEESSKCLQHTLRALTKRLGSLSTHDATIDPVSVASTAEAIYKVSQALSQVKQLEWGERQARSL